MLAQSGGLFEANRFAKLCEVSRPTITNYLKVLEATFVANIVRPFSTHRATEIVLMPKVYGFDTGFVCCYKGWQELRPADMGILWEHFVLNEMIANLQHRDIFYWRDKRGHEVDFVLPGRRNEPVAIECKWNVDEFNPKSFKPFRGIYSQGENYVVAANLDREFTREYDGMRVTFLSLSGLIGRLGGEMQAD